MGVWRPFTLGKSSRGPSTFSFSVYERYPDRHIMNQASCYSSGCLQNWDTQRLQAEWSPSIIQLLINKRGKDRQHTEQHARMHLHVDDVDIYIRTLHKYSDVLMINVGLAPITCLAQCSTNLVKIIMPGWKMCRWLELKNKQNNCYDSPANVASSFAFDWAQ